MLARTGKGGFQVRSTMTCILDEMTGHLPHVYHTTRHTTTKDDLYDLVRRFFSLEFSNILNRNGDNGIHTCTAEVEEFVAS